MRKYLILITVTVALATYEAAHACGNHNKSKTELQSQFSGSQGGRGAVGGSRFVASNKGAPTSALDPKFFENLNQTGNSTGPFNSSVSDSTKSE